MRERLDRPRHRLPAVGAGPRRRPTSTAFGDEVGWPHRRQDAPRRLRRQGRRVVVLGRRARGLARRSADAAGAARWRRPAPRGEGRLRPRARRAHRPQPVRPGRGLASRRDRPDRRHLHGGPRPGARASTPTSPRSPPRPALRIAGELGVTGVLAVEMFEVPRPPDGRAGATSSTSSRCGRTTAATGRWTAPSPASSSSTCGPCSTCRSATRAPRAPWTVMANVLGGDYERALPGLPAHHGARPRAPRCTSTARACGPAARSATSTSAAPTSPTLRERGRGTPPTTSRGVITE